MRLFKTKPFARFAAKEGIRDSVLWDAIRWAEAGLVDAELGGGVIKQRLARQGQGKSGGFRSIILFRRGATAFFVYGFAKNDRDNIDRQELRAFRLLAAEMLEMNEPALGAALKNGTIMEIEGNG
jgi:hypothetical protein